MKFQQISLGLWGSPKFSSGLLVIVMTLLDMATRIHSTNVHNIHWNTSNPMFRYNSHDNFIDIKSGTHPYDQVNIVCPVYKPGTTEDAQEKYIIYSVSEEEFDTCRITQSDPKIIAVCDRPFKQMYFTITFRSFTPTPGGLEFRPGQNYYFISTSSRSDLHRRIGGRCSSHNMKVAFRVAPNPNYKYKVLGEEEEDNNTVIQRHHPFGKDYHSLQSSQSPPEGVEEEGDSPGYTTYFYPKSELDRAERNYQPVIQTDPSLEARSGTSHCHRYTSEVLLLTTIIVMMISNVIWT